MNRVQNWRFRWHLARAVQRRELHATLYSLGLYVILAVSIAAAATVLRNQIVAVQDSGLSVLSNPFAGSFLGAVVLSSLYLALTSTVTIARERDQGTLEVLFYAPMDPLAYLLGKYLAQLAAYALMVIVYLATLAVYALVTNLAFTPRLLGAVLLSVITASTVVAVGFLLSTLNRSARGALVALLGIIAVFLTVQLGHDYVAGLTAGLPVNRANPLLFLQTVLAWLDEILSWLSPFAHLERGIDALLRGSLGEYGLMLALSLVYSVFVFGLAVRALQHRGGRA